MVEHARVFDGAFKVRPCREAVGIFVEESIGGGIDSCSNAKGLGNTFAELGFASAEIALESENKRELTSEVEKLAGEQFAKLNSFFN